jgi:alkylhydroperoxidase family enzyme
LEQSPETQLDDGQRALLDYTRKLAREPQTCEKGDIERIRRAGATDEQIHLAVQVAAYFCYMNRVASGLGVELEPEHRHGEPDEGSRRTSDE